jgi:hypothetical protein
MKNARHIALVLALALAVAVAAPAIAATFSSGLYKGKTSQTNKRTGKKRKIQFRVDAANGEVRNLKFVETGKCNDGGSSLGSQNLDLYIDDDGNFVDQNFNTPVRAKSDSGATKLTLTGKVTGTTAKGNFTIRSRFTSGNPGEPDPDGPVKCTTGKVTWSAKLVE